MLRAHVSVDSVRKTLVSLVCFWAVATMVLADSQWEWEGVPRVVILGDVHGAYDKLITLLVGTETVDEQLNWVGGEQHLVFCGDLTDRGTNDRAVMDLARRLQTEAAAAGGRVHVVLGNHEIMNLTRDRRYWTPELLDEFAKDETGGERNQGLRDFRAAQRTQVAGDARAFDEKFPPGYFARARAFEPDGEYGSWLLEQPTVVKVNGVVFVHGGLTRRVAALGLDEINRQVIADMRAFLSGADAMGKAVPWPADFGLIVAAADQLAAKGGKRKKSSPKVDGARAVLEAQEGLAFEPAGPVWYRGSSVDDERVETERVLGVLESLDARAEVMGHTPTRSGRISSRFNGRIYRADVGMAYGREPLAAVLMGGKVFVYDPALKELTVALAENPVGEGWPAGEEDLSDHQLEKFLAQAEIKSRDSRVVEGLPLKILELERKDMTLRAIYGDAQETAEQAAAEGRKARRMYQHQVAAYRLDRLFGLDMVPVTVIRKVDGKEGAVQIWIQGALDKTVLDEYDSDYELLEGLEPQFARARAFSGLIGLQERKDIGKVVIPSIPRRIMLADNGESFTDDGNVENYLAEGCGPVGDSFLHALRTLELQTMKKDLGEFLSEAQIEAILQRRDGLLEMCATPNPDWSMQKLLARG